jgi:pimeloyl-ACP methyl ester carboxylesterase
MNMQASASTPRRLVLVLHGYMKGPADVEQVVGAIREVWPDAKIVVPKLPMTLLSLARPNEIVVRLADLVDARWRADGEYDEIVFVGHSFGALLARKLYVVACGECARAPFEDSLRQALQLSAGQLFRGYAWAGSIRRIVLLAAMNRGWRVSHHVKPLRAVAWSIGTVFGSLIWICTRRLLLILTIRKGSRFITNLRIQWIVLRNELVLRNVNPPVIVQLLGSIDDMVAPDDNVDLVSGSNFIYLDVPESTHETIVRLDGEPAAAARREIFIAALSHPQAVLERDALIPSDDRLLQPDRTVKNVVFVIHGIRDEGHWTHKIARRVLKLGRLNGGNWAMETSSYGYFAMLPFLLPLQRIEKVEWMMDQYVEVLARYPAADLHYVGHSNGTYLLAKSLERYRSCRFRRVVFAGSVVRRRYRWSDARAREQVQSILNFVATRDWVVAFFPGLFEVVRVQDLGSAGHNGFHPVTPNLIQQVRVAGGHGVAVREHMWEDIAQFLVSGRAPQLPTPTPRPNWIIYTLGLFPLIVWVGIGWALVLLWEWIARVMPSDWSRGFAFAIYLGIIFLVLRRV